MKKILLTSVLAVFCVFALSTANASYRYSPSYLPANSSGSGWISYYDYDAYQATNDLYPSYVNVYSYYNNGKPVVAEWSVDGNIVPSGYKVAYKIGWEYLPYLNDVWAYGVVNIGGTVTEQLGQSNFYYDQWNRIMYVSTSTSPSGGIIAVYLIANESGVEYQHQLAVYVD